MNNNHNGYYCTNDAYSNNKNWIIHYFIPVNVNSITGEMFIDIKDNKSYKKSKSNNSRYCSK